MAIDKAVNSAKLEREMKVTANAIRTQGKTEADIPWEDEIGFEQAVLAIKTGAELNFEVVGGTTQPKNPKENTIWISTSTAITGWAFSVNAPSAPISGMVWITTGTVSGGSFNALKENAIYVYPVEAKQYVLGAWVDKVCNVYHGGSWKKLSYTLKILSNGAIASEAGSYVAAGTTGFNGTVYSPAIDISYGNYGYFSKKIDVTSFKTLSFTFSSHALYDGSLPTYVGLAHTGMVAGSYAGQTPKFVAAKTTASNGAQTITVDVSRVTGSYYVAIVAIAAFTITAITLKT